MSKTKVKFIRIVFSVFIFSSVIFNYSYVQAAYTAGDLVTLTNSARGREGLGDLAVNEKLSAAASAKAQDMLANQYFAHTSPQGKTPWDFIKDAGYDYAYAGENLAIGYSNASELFNAWMASTTHRENILNPNFREIGIAVLSGSYQGEETTIVAQEFGTLKGVENQPVTANQNQTPTATPTASLTNAQNFGFIREKTSFSPQNVYVGEEANFKVTITGEVQTLEVQMFDQRINLLESTASLSSAGQEKTFSLDQKMEKEGTSEVKIYAKDKSGNEQYLPLGQIEVKPTIVAKNGVSEQTSWFAGFKDGLKDNWLLLAVFGGIVLTIVGFLIFRKIKFSKITKLGMSVWEL